MKSQDEKHSGWLLIIGIIVGVLAITAGPALAALTFSGTSISGDGAVVIDSSSTISIGTSTATRVMIGNDGSSTVHVGSGQSSLDSYGLSYIACDSANLEVIGINHPTVSNTGVIEGIAETNNTGGFQPAGIYGIGFANPPPGGSSALIRAGDFDVSNVGANPAGQLASVTLYGENANGGTTQELDGLYVIYLSSNTGETNDMYGVRIGGMDPAAVESAGLKIDDQSDYSIKTGLGKVKFGDVVQIATSTFSGLPSCNPGEEGTLHPVTDSATSTLGATISGSGSNHVLAYCDGTNWTVMAK